MEVGVSELNDITQNVWSTVLGLELTDGLDESVLKRERAIAGTIQVSGPREVAVVVLCTAVLARMVTGAMLCMEPEEASSDDVQDALGEITNIVGGGVKNLLPGPSQMTLPTVAQGIDFSIRMPGAREVFRTGFTSQGEPLLVVLLERERRG